MAELSIKEFRADRTQKEAASQLGVNQSAVSQMLASGRDIRIRISEDGAVLEAYEFKQIGRTDARATA